MTCQIHKYPNRRLSGQLETLQEDLQRLSELMPQLAGLPDEEVAAFEISDQFQNIHRCLNRFEARCVAIQITAYEDEYAAPVDEESIEPALPVNNDWTIVRREAKRVNKHSSQLTSSLSKIRAGLGEYQNPGVVPEDIIRINRAVGNAVSGLASDCLLDHG
jgi:hypothetical protein